MTTDILECLYIWYYNVANLMKTSEISEPFKEMYCNKNRDRVKWLVVFVIFVVGMLLKSYNSSFCDCGSVFTLS